MPLPVAHSLAGYLFYDAEPFLFFKKRWLNFLFIIGLANLPDLDFLPGYMVGEPSLFHHGISHTLGMALIVALALAFSFRKKNPEISYLKYFCFIFLIYYSHIFMDFLTEDYRKPFGVMLFWPFKDIYYCSPVSLFAKTDRSAVSADFFQSLFTMGNLRAIVREGLVMGVAFVSYHFFKKLKKV